MEDPKNAVLSKDGLLLRPEVHDGELCGLFYCFNDNIIILVRSVQGKTLGFCLEKVERLRGEDLREGSIILDITVVPPSMVDGDEVADLLGVREGRLDRAVADRLVTDAMSRLSSGEVIFVRLDPSYGCSFACICHAFRHTENWLEEIEKCLH